MSDTKLHNATTKIANTILHDTVIMTAAGEVEPLIMGDSQGLRLESEFGPYHIRRELGAGGMGEVYEALDTESGRRIALKLLGRKLRGRPSPQRNLTQDKEWRERFYREGRLAAQVSHPNCVYVYGTGDVDGIPIIAMEYVAGGTLEDLVEDEGPLNPTRAVDMVLEIIEGLQAAAEVGVLHRDVKPSNCFLDVDDHVKIGDFGLSISTNAGDESRLTRTGVLLGTPAFASPEQLQGYELDSRSDIYAVGVTLFYLLTADIPFKGNNAVQLVASVLAQEPPSPTTMRQDIPKGLGEAVRRCMAKDSGARYQDYTAFRKALTPFSSQSPEPARIGPRFAAGVIDLILVNCIGFPVNLFSMWALQIIVFELGSVPNSARLNSPPLLLLALTLPILGTIYYSVFEGRWGASLGKGLLGLQVVTVEGSELSIRQSVLRAVIYSFAMTVFSWSANFLILVLNLSVSIVWYLTFQSVLNWGPFLSLFTTMRKRNGWATVQDLVSKTRVVQTRMPKIAPVRYENLNRGAVGETIETLGPYAITKVLYRIDGERLLLGYDSLLQREVWVHAHDEKTTDTSELRRDVNRLTRRRWVTGRHNSEESWDAYEAPPGQPFLESVGRDLSWEIVRRWLYDLGSELQAGLGDATLPTSCGLEHLWVKPGNQIILMDFPVSAHRLNTEKSASTLDKTDVVSMQRFLHDAATAALGTRATNQITSDRASARLHLPLHAIEILTSLRLGQYESMDAVLSALSGAFRRPHKLSLARRIAPVAFYASMLVPFAIASAFFADLPWSMLETIEPRIEDLNHIAGRLVVLEGNHDEGASEGDKELMAFQIYTAFHFAETINNQEFRENPYVATEKLRAGDSALKAFPDPTLEDVEAVIETVERYLADQSSKRIDPFFLTFIGIHTYLFIGGCLAVTVAFVFRGTPAKWIMGISIINAKGTKASRLRLAWRTAIVWSPWFFAIGGIVMGRNFGDGAALVYILFLLVVFAFGTALTLSGRRSIQDRLAGTYLVSR